jgi:hypothetical protein
VTGLARRALGLDIIGGVLGRADLLDHAHHILGRAAMRRPGQRGQRGDDGAVQVRLGADGDAGGKLEAFEPCSACRMKSTSASRAASGSGLLALQHPQPVGGMAQRRVRIDRRAPVADRLVRGDDHRHLRCQPHAIAEDRRLAGVSRLSGSSAASAETAVRSTSIGCPAPRADDVEHRPRHSRPAFSAASMLGQLRGLGNSP